MMGVPWRYLPLLSASGSLQMALDAWLVAEHRAGRMPALLRFYQFSPPALSLGYHQRAWPTPAVAIDCVRRPTGGRAVLHQGDLCYSLITSWIGQSRPAVYRQLCQFLIQGFAVLGCPLSFGTETAAGREANCFSLSTPADLVDSAGQKRIGSAQRWFGTTVLQQGSIPLQPDPDLWQAAWGRPLPDVSPLPPQDQVIEALVAAGRTLWGDPLWPHPLTEEEWAQFSQAQSLSGLPPSPAPAELGRPVDWHCCTDLPV
ncbi:MAG: lipoate--protein ligase family protein [Gloeomargaritaceae cyanobacterium C42_A2020_066]|nr:lipoate--protein ligase family protein [Gloeomargaritaceae cyanobacterium C42_A2020_066]